MGEKCLYTRSILLLPISNTRSAAAVAATTLHFVCIADGLLLLLQELPGVLQANFPTLDTSNASIMGHSMGGHGALTIALKNPGVYKSLSAFAPICNPCTVPWGIKAFTGYFGKRGLLLLMLMLWFYGSQD